MSNEYKIFSVSFGDQELEIVYYETRHDTPELGLRKIQTDLIAQRLFPEAISSILEDLGALLDEAHRLRSSPIRTVPSRVEEEDDEGLS